MARIPGMEWHLHPEKILSREQMGRILEVAREWNARDYMAILTAANTGLRVCEVMHLKRDDVLENGRLQITRRKKRVLQPTVIDVVGAFWNMLKEWADSMEGWLFPGDCAPCQIVRMKAGVKQAPEQVCGGGHLHIRTLQSKWRLFVAQAGLTMRGRGIHSTRHYAITEFVTVHGGNIRAGQLFAGHSSSSMTEKYVAVRDMREKVNAMPATI